ncbi:MAG TPA: tetratricopeptide repeat protein [Patescibacteria group bacterium]|nr:tetratricopeptide repeat protein [Patescibacteria group bacterium]
MKPQVAVPKGSESEIEALVARARNEEAGAQEALGNRYETGNGVGQDYVEAAEWYRKAADQGITKAQKELGSLYARGLGVPRDYEEAYFWLSLSTDPLSVGANPELAEISGYMRPDQRADVEKRLAEWKPSRKHGAAMANAVERRGEVIADTCATKYAVAAVHPPRHPSKKCKEAYKVMKSSCGQNASCNDCEQGLDDFKDSCGPQEEADPAYQCNANEDCGLVDVDCNAPFEPVSVRREYMDRERKINAWPPQGCPRVPAERMTYRALCSNQLCTAVENDDAPH